MKPEAAATSRISTGNAQADEILGGGFSQNSIKIIMGQPGTGKTVFAENLVFHNATGERPVLYLTTLSEPMAKMLTWLTRNAFPGERRAWTRFSAAGCGGAARRYWLAPQDRARPRWSLSSRSKALRKVNPRFL